MGSPKVRVLCTQNFGLHRFGFSVAKASINVPVLQIPEGCLLEQVEMQIVVVVWLAYGFILRDDIGEIADDRSMVIVEKLSLRMY